MPLLNQRVLKSDPWEILDDNEDIVTTGDIVVTFDRLVAEFKSLMLHTGRLGVAFPNNRPAADLEPYLQRLQLVTLDFPLFTDGRAYSQAREIRKHMGFAGELRATGNLLPDQLSFMQQVGFDYFSISDERFDLETWLKAAQAISLSYQRTFASRGQTSVHSERRTAIENDAEDWLEQPHYG